MQIYVSNVNNMLRNDNLHETQKEVVEELKNLYNGREANTISKLLFEHMGFSRIDLITDKSGTLSSDQIALLQSALERIKNHEPIQYITGRAHFYGMDLKVNPNVLIPRQETEELVDLIIQENINANPRILDIGTGSGCIALSLKKNIEGARIDALDISEESLIVAIDNSKEQELNVHFHHLDILHEAFLPGEYDIIVSNPPYVVESEKTWIKRNVLDFEPHRALFVPEVSPLVFYDCIVELAIRHLHPEGKLYFEINERFGKEVKSIMTEAGLTNIRIIKDLNDKNRIASAIFPG